MGQIVFSNCRHILSGIESVSWLRRDTRAAVLVEFALVCLPFFALLFGIVQICSVLFLQQVLETSAEKGARLLLAGVAQKQGQSAQTFKAEVCKTLPSFLSCNRLYVDVSSASDFSQINTATPPITLDGSGNPTSAFSYQTGSAGDIVVLKVIYVQSVTRGLMGLNLANAGTDKRIQIATSVVKTENF